MQTKSDCIEQTLTYKTFPTKQLVFEFMKQKSKGVCAYIYSHIYRRLEFVQQYPKCLCIFISVLFIYSFENPRENLWIIFTQLSDPEGGTFENYWEILESMTIYRYWIHGKYPCRNTNALHLHTFATSRTLQPIFFFFFLF